MSSQFESQIIVADKSERKQNAKDLRRKKLQAFRGNPNVRRAMSMKAAGKQMVKTVFY